MRFERGQTLEDYFIGLEMKQFPKQIDFITVYKFIKPILRNQVQNFINQGSHDSITVHDSSHFDAVTKATTELLKVKKFELTPYEIFLLLCAIQVHDIGNLLGRVGHEKTLEEIYYDLIPEIPFKTGFDDFDERTFLNIAQAHTGNINGDKDTINLLLPEPLPNHHDEDFRQQMLAALLRFADELCEGPERAQLYLLFKDRLTKESEINHFYADSLKTTKISAIDHKLKLSFKFTIDKALRKFTKGDTQKFLLDEIFDRNIKLHFERIYCNKFLPAKLQIHKIHIDICVYSQRFKEELIPPIVYEMIDKGYPSDEGFDIAHYCVNPINLNSPLGQKWDGQVLQQYLANK